MYNKSFIQMAMALSGMGGEYLESQVEKSIFGGASGELSQHLRKNNRSLQEEYELIQQKKSSLSRRMRGYVEYLHSKSQETKEEGEDEA